MVYAYNILLNPYMFRRYYLAIFRELTPTFLYRGADRSLARPTSRCIFFDGENNSFDASLVIYIYIYIYIYKQN
jgi:hypothetical protein